MIRRRRRRRPTRTEIIRDRLFHPQQTKTLIWTCPGSSALLRRRFVDDRLPLFTDKSTAADVFDAIGLLRDGVLHRDSPFHINGFGPVSFNAVVDWLVYCGHPADAFCIERQYRLDARQDEERRRPWLSRATS